MTLAHNLPKAGRGVTIYGVHGYAYMNGFPIATSGPCQRTSPV
ncbi:hypothetical protein [Achromobacter dolens]|jgi:hypothetical protein|nr:hypothetical protein [Achromobacter dolens]MCZ8408561.1 hypothetical protein [Achromobacter dolens]